MRPGFVFTAFRRGGGLAFTVQKAPGGHFRPEDIIELVFTNAPAKVLARAKNSAILSDGAFLAAGALVEEGRAFELTGFFDAPPPRGPARGETRPVSSSRRGTSELKIPYEDDFLAVVEKPAGVLVHSDGTGARRETLAAMLESHFARRGDLLWRAYPVHRLDVGTSGLIIFAKDNMTCAMLDRAILDNAVLRRYIAVVEGELKSRSGVINLPIGRDRHVSNRYRVSRTGKPAVTRYKLTGAAPGTGLSAVEIELETGRTHQIRVHFSHIGHPLAGDALYGAKSEGPSGREFALHSSFVSFHHPYSKKKIEIASRPDFID